MQPAPTPAFLAFLQDLERTLSRVEAAPSRAVELNAVQAGDAPMEIDARTSRATFAARLRAVADHVEQGRGFDLRVGGRHIRVPAGIGCSILLDRDEQDVELQFLIHWSSALPGTELSAQRKI